MMSQKLPWSSVWITGAGKGIGKSLAELLARHGLTVYASSRTSDDLERLKRECEHYSGRIIPIPLDTTDRISIGDFCKRWDIEGVPDLVILNAGTHDPFTAQEFCAERCHSLLQTNLQGTINCIDPVLKRFIHRGTGQIAIMASVAGYRGLPTSAVYGASKAALIHLCEALRLDLDRTDIKLQVINPGFVRTPLTDKNSFEMPALVEPNDAAERILRGLLSDRFEITFPKRLAYVLNMLRILPYSWYFKIISHSVKVD